MHYLFVRPAGAERDIPNIAGGPFLPAWARPVNAPERSAAEGVPRSLRDGA
jgi:hypothetical protein